MWPRITGDFNSESRVDECLDESGPTEDYFASREYGAGLFGIGVVLMCRNPELNFKRRIRFDRKDKKLYMDVMLDLPQMLQATPEVRKKIIAARLMRLVCPALQDWGVAKIAMNSCQSLGLSAQTTKERPRCHPPSRD